MLTPFKISRVPSPHMYVCFFLLVKSLQYPPEIIFKKLSWKISPQKMQSTVEIAVSKGGSSENFQTTEKVVGSSNNSSTGLNRLKPIGLKRVVSFQDPSKITKTRHLSHEYEDSGFKTRNLYKKPKIGTKATFYGKQGGQNVISNRTIKDPEETMVNAQLEAVTESFSQQRLDDVEDIDTPDRDNIWLCIDYIQDIMKYMISLEKKYPVSPNFLSVGRVNTRMRAVLMDWLVQVHYQYNFAPETLYLCNKIMDRFLTVDTEVSKTNFQLVGVTALLLACKYEEVYVPPIREFVRLSDQAFTTAQMREMEMRILIKLKFDLSSPQPSFFLRRFSRAAKSDLRLHSLAKYIMELSVIDFSLVDLMPSFLAASSLALAIMILRNMTLLAAWNKTMEYYSTYSVDTIRPGVIKMASALARAHDDSQLRLKAIREKYASTRRNCRVSRLPELNLENWKERILKELEEPINRWNQNFRMINNILE
ncbi:unnamed protein product [Allacma fusca]|uniref:Cyclin B n=1 Tax=Allacma fusca TaxID=39272 RepID=A0A8J2JNG5_9HEXA|nr:unnamed protein product [Allacma fusca]